MRKFNRLITFMSGLMLVTMVLALVPLPVSAGEPPVSTDEASGITTTSATLNGDLKDMGTASSVDVTFEWGINKNGPYTNEITPSQAMNTTGAFSSALTGLDGGITYYFRAKAVGDDTSYGKEKNFTTVTIVTTEAASDITANSATLNGNLDSLGTASSVDVTFEWGTSSGSYSDETTPETMSGTGAFSFDLSGLNPDTTYYFRAKADGGVYGTSYGDEKHFTATTTPSPSTLYVDDDYNEFTPDWGVDHFDTIQAAINATSPGDTIFVAAGTYNENVDVNKSLTLQGEGSAVVTVTAANSKDHVFEVTAYNVTISGFTARGATENGKAGIYLDQANLCNISANTCSNTTHGIYLDHSDNNTLTSNTANLNSECGIYLDNSDNNTLTGNTANSNTKYGIYLDGLAGSNSSTLTGNTANQNGECGIYVDKSSSNTLTSNTANLNSECGIYLDNSNNNTLTSNTANSNTEYGIYLDNSGSNNLAGNAMSGNSYNFYVVGSSLPHYVQAIDTTNTVDEKPVYYRVEASGEVIGASTNAGYVGVINSTNVTVKDLTLTKGGQGVLFAYTSHSSIENVTVSNNYYGIYLDNSDNNTLTSNCITSNNIGIKLQGAVDASTTMNFNNIHGNTEYGVENSGSGTADATNNWWGANDGPSNGAEVSDPVTDEPANGSGDKVSANVHFDPWFGAGVEDSKTLTTTPGDDFVDATTEADTEVTKSGDGTPIITVAKYESNPGGTIPGGFMAADEYIDVHLDSTEDVGQIEIKNYYTAAQVAGLVESSLRMRWWNGESWVQCSDSGLNTNDVNGYSGYVWAIITDSTTPNLTDLSGAVFGIIGTSPPTEGEAEGEVGGGGGALGYWVVIIDNLGKITEAKVSPSGELLESVRATDAEGQIALELDRGTKILCPGGKVPQRLEMKTIQILRPQDMVILGQVYRLDAYLYEYSPNPSLLTISPPGKLTLSYDLSELPPNSLAVFAAYYDTQKGWVELPSADITEAGKLTTEISGPMIFTLMVKLGPPPSLAEPGFRPSNLVIEPGEANPRQEISISLIVTNIGGAAGTCTLELKVDGVVRSVKSVSLEPGESEVVSFSITEDMEGKHMVEIADLKGDFSIVLIPFPWWLLSTAAIPPVIIILERRRRWKQRVAWSTGLKTKDWLVK